MRFSHSGSLSSSAVTPRFPNSPHTCVRKAGFPIKNPASEKPCKTSPWKKGRYLATDVRPENALVAESTGTIHPIDFIVAGKELG